MILTLVMKNKKVRARRPLVFSTVIAISNLATDENVVGAVDFQITFFSQMFLAKTFPKTFVFFVSLWRKI